MKNFDTGSVIAVVSLLMGLGFVFNLLLTPVKAEQAEIKTELKGLKTEMTEIKTEMTEIKRAIIRLEKNSSGP